MHITSRLKVNPSGNGRSSALLAILQGGLKREVAILCFGLGLVVRRLSLATVIEKSALCAYSGAIYTVMYPTNSTLPGKSVFLAYVPVLVYGPYGWLTKSRSMLV